MMNSLWQLSVILMQARVNDQAAFILRSRNWRDSSLILDIFTFEHGRLSLLAKGARRHSKKSQFQPFVLLNLCWSGRGDLKTLVSIEEQPLQVSEQNYLSLLYVNELISAFLPQAESNPEIFRFYLLLLNSSRQPGSGSELRQFELSFLRCLGYFPDISCDANSGEKIESAVYYQFVINLGFVACDSSAKDSVMGQIVLDWIADDFEKISVRHLAKSVLRSTIDHNLQGRTLKSRLVYQDLMKQT